MSLYNHTFNRLSLYKTLFDLAGAVGFEPTQPPSEGYHGFRDRCPAVRRSPNIKKDFSLSLYIYYIIIFLNCQLIITSAIKIKS